jgi:pyrimidine-specific ribonucleoside hydrolase
MIKKRSRYITLLISGYFLLIFFLPIQAHEGMIPSTTINFKEFPTDPVIFNDDLKPFMSQIIAKHGLEEWKAVVLTNELHHHMGLWSIVGAKMGLRAREIMSAPYDELAIESSAGFKPPFSCLNDGLQVSTGATLGRGTIKITEESRPIVIFTFNRKKIIMRVKPEIIKEIGTVIKECSDKYVFQSPRYFSELDKISIQYWLKWDRTKLFDEEIAPMLSK